ncbi:hypothetical protein [Amylibacter sp. IMCC11727]|uniref:hypothetical protein n=1 Tax=Amylibacter sp. IMCC11727 TaxID=3039851 RepID=UPI00244E3335|nr:hypothetical protein [Amylibacter sp. IMCC11727]WGI21642.1 hypothetical protein QBD29_16245 [Amylibacter sp. IMCC11727]
MPRGGAPVGFLRELPETEAAAVCFLRLWCESDDTQRQAVRDLNDLLGAAHGSVAVESLRQICDLFRKFARRPVMRHHSGCSCLGADEACFANLIAEAAIGNREDAMLFSMLLVRADFAPVLAGLAEQFGVALSLLNKQTAPPLTAVRPQGATVH